MKKSIFIAVLGMAACVATSYGQGYVAFNTYSSNSGVGSITTMFDGTTPVSGAFTAELFYALGTVSDPVDMGSMQSVLTAPSGSFTALPLSVTSFDSTYLGYLFGQTATIANYVSGPITFEIVATGPGYYGRSGSFTESGLSTSPLASPTFFGDGGPGSPNFVVAPVPEPTTLALAGLGGLASLVALRRKQA